jgi:hypothetical protein
MPFVAATRTATTQFIGVGLPEFEAPLPNRLIGHDDASLGHQFLNIPGTERKAEIQPHSVADHLPWETETFLIRRR